MSTNTIDGLRRKVVTLDDISQLRQCFHALESITQESMAEHNRMIRELHDVVLNERRKLEMLNEEYGSVHHLMTRAKLLVDPEATEEDLLADLVEREQNVINEELARKDDQITGAVRHLEDWDDDRLDIKQRIEAAKKDYENLKRSVYERVGGGANPNFGYPPNSQGSHRYGSSPSVAGGSVRGGSFRGGSFRGGSFRRGGGRPEELDDGAIVHLLEDRFADQQRKRFQADQQIQDMEAHEEFLARQQEDRELAQHEIQNELKDIDSYFAEMSRRIDNPRVWQHVRFADPPAGGLQSSAAPGTLQEVVDKLRHRDDIISEEFRLRDDALHEVGSRIKYYQSGAIDDELHALSQDMDIVDRNRSDVDRELQRLRDMMADQEYAEKQRQDQGQRLQELDTDLKHRANDATEALHNARRDVEASQKALYRVRDEEEHLTREYHLRQDDLDEQQHIIDFLFDLLGRMQVTVDERYQQVEYVTAKLDRVEEDRRQKHDVLRRYKHDELSMLNEPAPGVTGDHRS